MLRDSGLEAQYEELLLCIEVHTPELLCGYHPPFNVFGSLAGSARGRAFGLFVIFRLVLRASVGRNFPSRDTDTLEIR